VTSLVEIPPLFRTAIYYLLAVVNAGYLAYVAVFKDSNQWVLFTGAFVAGLSALFFGVAGSKVSKPADAPADIPAVVGPDLSGRAAL
jgi:hypothetical protein